MQFDVIIPTRGTVSNIRTMLQAIQIQTVLPEHIIFVVNGSNIKASDLIDAITEGLSSNIVSKLHVKTQSLGNASAARNMGIKNATSEYIYILDDDNTFGNRFFEDTLKEYQLLYNKYNKMLVLSPTIMRRNTTTIQSQGMKGFHYLTGRPEPVLFGGWKNKFVTRMRFLFPLSKRYKNNADHFRVSAVGGNSLFGPKQIFSNNLFDEKIPFVYEDIDMLYGIAQKKIPVIVSKNLFISHMERDKTLLEQSFFANFDGAYQKSKNRIFFVRKHGNVFQKTIFFIIALPVTSIMTLGFLVFAGGKSTLNLLKGYLKGIYDGIMKKI